MKNQGILRASSSHNVCILCASRLSGTSTSPLISPQSVSRRRYFNTSRSTSQSTAAATNPREADGDNGFTSPRGNLQGPNRGWGTFAKTPRPKLPLASESSAQRPQVEPSRRVKWNSPSQSVEPPESQSRPIIRYSRTDKGNFSELKSRSILGKQSRGSRSGGVSSSRGTLNGSEYIVSMGSAAPERRDDRGFNSEHGFQWSHLRRRGSPRNVQPVHEDQRAYPSPSSPSQDPVLKEYSRGQRLREKQAKEGRFVGLSEETSRMRCYVCGQIGHRAAQCPAKTLDARTRTERKTRLWGKEGEAPDKPSREEIAAEAARVALQDEDFKKKAKKFVEIKEEEYQQAQRFTEISRSDRGYAEEEAPRRRGKDKPGRRSRRSDEEEEAYDAGRARAERKRERKRERELAAQRGLVPPTPIYLPEFISVANLGVALRVRVDDLIKKMERLGFDGVMTDHVLDAENAGLIAMEYNFEPIIGTVDDDLQAAPSPEDPSKLPLRPPVVTIMGHVDHGKTTILDFLRKSSIAASEHGGITQHIGAFSVPLSSGKTITFLDTPGHAAFLNMRQRGANVTDIVILVVAADDSVMPQTIEAIKHAKGAGVPIIVAINKMDKEEAAPDRVMSDLANHGVVVENFGGDTQVVCVSGKTGHGMQELEDAIILQSEILDHRAPPDGAVEGWVLEAAKKKSGKVATVLVRRGTLRPGDVLVAGKAWTRIKTLKNEAGSLVDEVGPGMAAEVDGWREQPEAGDEVLQASDEQQASDVVDLRVEKADSAKLAEDMEAINEARRMQQERRAKEEAAKVAAGNGEDAKDTETVEAAPSGPQEVHLVLKADVSGSVEAVVNSVSGLGNHEVRPNIIRQAVGSVSESDVEHAAAANGAIVMFNTIIEPKMRHLAELKGVKILDHNIIYRLVDDVRAVLSEKLPPVITQRVIGEAEIAQAFSITVKGKKQVMIAGCKVRNGVVRKSGKVRVLRGKEVTYEGTISSLRSGKKDVQEMKNGTECGIGFEEWDAFTEGDKIQVYEEISEKRTL